MNTHGLEIHMFRNITIEVKEGPKACIQFKFNF